MPGQIKSPVRTLGVLTGGGDVPGLNAAIKALVYRAETLGISVIGLRYGWRGITFLNRNRPREEQIFRADDPQTWDDHYLLPLNRQNTRTIDRQGGTILLSTRTNPARVRVSELPEHLKHRGEGRNAQEYLDLTDEVLANIEFLGLDGLVVIGGDDTLSYGAVLGAKGVPVWGIPKTMDNDVPGTDYCIGFQTAINRASEFIGRLRSTLGSHSETALFRLFGRDAGFTALETAIVTWADRLLIPEVPANIDQLAELVASDRRNNPNHYSIVVLSEGANLGMPVPEVGPEDAYGHRKKANVAEFLAEQLSKRLPGVRFLPIDLTYILRSGEPDVYDRHMAIYFANMAMSLVEQGIHGAMAGYREGKIIYTDLPGKDKPPRRVNPDDYHPTRYRPRFERISGPYMPL
ncbi:MAG: 6-phosphofructokinase [Thermogemmatispora sp.]|jgi:6-phosphofructokinase|uniref:6-phosphofructokinase n=1 Tax=Thermogemmatispora aurantia TaxID=2045279 RepID=A0A5J4K662_9CHLR|nr:MULTISPECIES: 6-phosphofructokinase [Thermogemmatispora]MBE3566585.1 6-phosphofructokinase [Thermogemmatispora sp.]GER83025.1 6-phosphofructokinase [Thermogemmatispora aurantia]